MSEGKTICVDFDGVIHKYTKGWQNGEIYDSEVEGVREALEKLISKGYKIVICTARGKEYFDSMYKWLSEHKLGVHTHFHEVTNEKPPAVVYIDDRGIRFTNWKDMLNYFL